MITHGKTVFPVPPQFPCLIKLPVFAVKLRFLHILYTFSTADIRKAALSVNVIFGWKQSYLCAPLNAMS
jgi:hypothetical protein